MLLCSFSRVILHEHNESQIVSEPFWGATPLAVFGARQLRPSKSSRIVTFLSFCPRGPVVATAKPGDAHNHRLIFKQTPWSVDKIPSGDEEGGVNEARRKISWTGKAVESV